MSNVMLGAQKQLPEGTIAPRVPSLQPGQRCSLRGSSDDCCKLCFMSIDNLMNPRYLGASYHDMIVSLTQTTWVQDTHHKLEDKPRLHFADRPPETSQPWRRDLSTRPRYVFEFEVDTPTVFSMLPPLL
jgi:hypothetical protein